MNVYWLAAVWMILALVASLISVKVALPVALAEVVVGAVAGNIPGHEHLLLQTDFTKFLAMMGSVVLTFLAGAEVDPESLVRGWKSSLSIGFVSFLAPCLAAFAFTSGVLHWSLHSAEIAGLALSTTSVAVVYAVMIETGLNKVTLGKTILAACFVTDLATVVALGGLFANYNWILAGFLVAMTITVWLLPRITRRLVDAVGGRVSEPEVKFVLVILMVLGGLAFEARSEAVLPAYLVGLMLARLFLDHPVLSHRLRSIAFGVLTPFFFLQTGALISLPALISGVLIVCVLFGVELAGKLLAVWPVARAFKMPPREATYTSLLMASGLTFGSIAALYGLNHGYINGTQYSELVSAVILSAIIPSVIAQRHFVPRADLDPALEGALSAEDAVFPHHRNRGGSESEAPAA